MKTLHAGENIGGVARIELCHVADLLSFNPIRFKSGRYWQQVEHVPDSGTLIDEEQETDNGITYSYSGAFKRQHPSADDEVDLSRYIGQCTIMRIRDLNGRTYVIGSPDCAVTFSRSGNRGARPSDMAHNEFRFSVLQIVRAACVLSY